MRKEQKLVLGFVGTVTGIIGVLHVYLPFYSDLGLQAQERAGMRTNRGENASVSRRTASMWKNMDQQKKQQTQQPSQEE
ncbi:hypothetical protein Poli38472_009859 [Pythium oligandrum]|uniref:Uncharacterized protein n=1 Tax=Pythium oligandrum TaxID=41045 RepID=A0A8K1CGF8_PYTOL|nr:hypothetical protein Poli38472_009859 [Pythium oligandrum]|eukprot:TMW62366.1 hypothetical protein Poli38472_009859 [Pythium oligandrum]